MELIYKRYQVLLPTQHRQFSSRFYTLLFCLFFCVFFSSSVSAATPVAWRGLPADAYTLLDGKNIRQGASQLSITLDQNTSFSFDIRSRTQHANGDTSVSGPATDLNGSINATFGDGSVFGRIHRDDKDYVLTTDNSGSWAIELPASGVSYNSCGMQQQTAANVLPAIVNSQDNAIAASAQADTTLDILLIYNRAFADRYPGNLLETRFNHYVQIANQSMVNSDISLALRVVGMEFFDYRNDNTNSELLGDMANALSGQVIAGLEGLQSLRDDRGADLTIMFRPHDIETRGSCGIAYYPDNNPNLGVNVVSDGMSSWSVCLDDVMTHEIGHNLGAAHQAGFGGGSFDPRGAAFVRPGQYSTMMASFGTGRPDRFRGLPVFSNPEVQCGGQACGSVDIDKPANNAVVMRSVMTAVAAYRASTSDAPEPVLPPVSTNDSDNDGVIDRADHFPFDMAENSDADLDGSGDTGDAFPNDPDENLDTDLDQIGNNADMDDDGDLIADKDDRFPLDASESADADDDGTGDNADAFPQRAREFADSDADGIGNNEDDDDDGDGVPELSTVAEDILVMSIGNNRVLRFDAQTGIFRGVEILPDDGLLSFQSDLAYRSNDNTLIYTSASALKRMDLLNRNPLGVYVPAYADAGIVQLGSGFPTGVATSGDGSHIIITRMGDREIGLFTGQNQAFDGADPNWVLSENESPIDVIASGDKAIILGQASRTLYAADATGTTFLSNVGSEWMQDPHRMVESGDGRLLISDQGRNSVVAVDIFNGSFLGDFAVLSDHGYSNPTGLAVTRSGQLLVASADNNVILRYDIQSGDFLGELIGSGAGGLSRPHAMTIVPQWLDRFGTDPDRVIRPNGGLWFNPDSNGRGFDIEVFGNRLSAIWYTFDENGQPVWYLSAGVLNGFTYEAALKLTRLSAQGVFETEDVGSLRLEFSSERSASMNWTIGGLSGGESLQWIEFDVEPAADDFTGIWGREDGPGWGVTLVTEGKRSVAIAYIYDLAGQPRWVISDPVQGGSLLEFSMKVAFNNTLCPGCEGNLDTRFESAGAMSMMFSEYSQWSSAIQFPAPLNGSWTEDQTPVIRFSETPDRPR